MLRYTCCCMAWSLTQAESSFRSQCHIIGAPSTLRSLDMNMTGYSNSSLQFTAWQPQILVHFLMQESLRAYIMGISWTKTRSESRASATGSRSAKLTFSLFCHLRTHVRVEWKRYRYLTRAHIREYVSPRTVINTCICGLSLRLLHFFV